MERKTIAPSGNRIPILALLPLSTIEASIASLTGQRDQLNAEISQLQVYRGKLMNNGPAPAKPMTGKTAPGKTRELSPEARKRISDAASKRHAEQRLKKMAGGPGGGAAGATAGTTAPVTDAVAKPKRVRNRKANAAKAGTAS